MVLLFYVRYGTVLCRRYSRAASSNYGKSLLKKFVFQVHPDYFENQKAMQKINATNLSILQNLMEGTSSKDTQNTRSLAFYIKPLSEDTTPKRVKVSLHRLEKSIVEILETIGVDVPTEGSQTRSFSRYASTVLATPKQTLDYLESMHERKDLVAWREEHTRILLSRQKILLAITGAKAVEYRNSWSAQNNAIMLSRLIALIRQHAESLSTPWTNMSIVFSKDASEFRLNYLDREIILDPTDVPDQWLVVLQSVNPDAIREVELHARKFEILHSKFESMVHNVLSHNMRQNTGNLIDDESHCGSDASAADIHVVVKRGFTCSLTNYFYFLHKMNKKSHIVEPVGLPGAEDSTATMGSNGNNNEHRVIVRPLEVSIVIEDSHGTKLLSDGTFRIDVRADTDDVQALLLAGSGSLADLARRHNTVQSEIEALTESLTGIIKWQSISPGVGVDSAKFLVCLQRMQEYTRLPETRAALLQLGGLRVLVGHYLGMADDGACILPWEIALPTAGGGDSSEEEDYES